MKNPAIHLIINPASAGGRTGDRIGRILALFERHFTGSYEIHITDKPGDATRFAREAVGRGCGLIACAGGDGTLQEAVNGLFAGGPLPTHCALGIISSGTGEGFARSLGLPRGIEEQIEILKRGRTRLADIGRIDFSPASSGETERRYFINEFQIGIGGEVVRRVNGGGHRLAGPLAYGGSALFAALRFTPRSLRIRAEGRAEFRTSCIGVVIANGEYTGGGMRLAPGADLSDGRLNVLLIHAQSLASRLRGFSRIYSGTHAALPGFSYFTTTRIEIEACGEMPQEADGQLLPSGPCAASILPSALPVFCADSSGVQS